MWILTCWKYSRRLHYFLLIIEIFKSRIKFYFNTAKSQIFSEMQYLVTIRKWNAWTAREVNQVFVFTAMSAKKRRDPRYNSFPYFHDDHKKREQVWSFIMLVSFYFGSVFLFYFLFPSQRPFHYCNDETNRKINSSFWIFKSWFCIQNNATRSTFLHNILKCSVIILLAFCSSAIKLLYTQVNV